MRGILEQFAHETSVHGVSKVIRSPNVLLRVFWLVVLGIATGMFITQLVLVLQRYYHYPKKVTVEVVPEPVPFPAISLCNMRNLDVFTLNEINRKFIEDHNALHHVNSSEGFIREYMKVVSQYSPLWYRYQAEYPRVFNQIFSRSSFATNLDPDILSDAGVQLEEFVVDCYHGDKPCNRSHDFTQFFHSYYYNCYRYTPPGNNVWRMIDSSSYGLENGWTSVLFTGNGLLDTNTDLRVLPGLHESQGYTRAVSASEGVRVVIHPPGTQPFPLTEGYDIPPGFSASFGIRPMKNIRLGSTLG